MDAPGRPVARTLRRVLALLILLVLIDWNATHVRDVVSELVAWWEKAQTQNEMGAIAACLDAEFASHSRYPDPDALSPFLRTWLPPVKDRDPSHDRWGTPYRLEPEGVAYWIRSCGPNRFCGDKDDVTRRGGPPVASWP